MKIQLDGLPDGKGGTRGLKSMWFVVYPFFLIHMFAFGYSGFSMAYADDQPNVMFLFMQGGLAIFVYMQFYFAIFGKEEVKWMFINAGLGILGIYSQIGRFPFAYSWLYLRLK